MEKRDTQHVTIRQKNEMLIWVAVLTALFIFVYHEILIRTVKSWVSFQGSYGLLIVIISAYLIWERRSKLISTDTAPAILSGTVATVTGLAIYLLSNLSNTLILQGIGLVVTLLGLVWMILGWRHLNMLVIPIGYLSFMFSFFEEVLGLFSGSLQRASANLAGFLIKSFGMPVIVFNELIELPHITLEVAKVCNGVNHIIALVALSVPIAVLRFSSLYQKIGLVILAFFVGLFANGLRVAMIGFWTLNHHLDSIHGPFEIFYVSFILVIGLVFIAGVTFVSNKFGLGAKKDHVSSLSGKSSLNDFFKKLDRGPFAYAIVLFAILIAYQYLFVDKSVELKNPIEECPKVIEGWKAKEIADKNWPFKKFKGNQQLRRIYQNPLNGVPIGLAISYFEKQTEDSEVVNQSLMWLHHRAEKVDIDVGEDIGIIQVNRGIARGIHSQSYKGDKRLFYFFYYINGKVLTDPYEVKLEILLSKLFKRRSNASMIIFTTENQTAAATNNVKENAKQFMRYAIPVVLKIISDSK
jgi:EpsI family protein